MGAATLNTTQQVGGSIGTALLNTIAASAATAYAASHLSPAIAASPTGRAALQAAAAVHGYTTGFWWAAAFFAAGAIICGSLMRPGPLARQAVPSASESAAPAGLAASPDARPQAAQAAPRTGSPSRSGPSLM